MRNNDSKTVVCFLFLSFVLKQDGIMCTLNQLFHLKDFYPKVTVDDGLQPPIIKKLSKTFREPILLENLFLKIR